MKKKNSPVNLKELAERLGLSQGTVSMALGPNAEASGVAAKTRERVLKAARELSYLPNFHARSLSSGRSYTAGVLVPAISDGYYSSVIAGIEAFLLRHGYFFFVTSHRWQDEMMEKLPDALIRRGVEGLIIVNTILGDVPLPSVRIGGSVQHANSTTIRINEQHGTRLAIEHLAGHGHREIAFFRGEAESAAAEERWNGVLRAAHQLDLVVDRRRTVQLSLHKETSGIGDEWNGYAATEELLASNVPFTAIAAYNDTTAIGAMRALQNAGLKVPDDVSVIGYDDIPASAYERPALTTVRQPLHEMGAIAAETLIRWIEEGQAKAEVLIEPELVVRGTVAPPPKSKVR